MAQNQTTEEAPRPEQPSASLGGAAGKSVTGQKAWAQTQALHG